MCACVHVSDENQRLNTNKLINLGEGGRRWKGWVCREGWRGSRKYFVSQKKSFTHLLHQDTGEVAYKMLFVARSILLYSRLCSPIAGSGPEFSYLLPPLLSTSMLFPVVPQISFLQLHFGFLTDLFCSILSLHPIAGSSQPLTEFSRLLPPLLSTLFPAIPQLHFSNYILIC